MRGRKCLVQVDVHRIDAQITRPHPPDDGVEIRTIAIDIAACGMDRIGNGLHVPFEQAACVGVSDHDAGHIRTKPRLQRIQINAPFGRCGNIFDRESGKGRRRRVGAMRAFGHQNDAAWIAPRFQCGLDRQYAAQLAMRTSLGCHGNAVHAGQFDQPDRQFIDNCKRTLHCLDRLQWMHVGKTCHPCDLFIQTRVMLHCAASQWEKAQINRIILAAQSGIVADRFGFGQAGHPDRAVTFQTTQA